MGKKVRDEDVRHQSPAKVGCRQSRKPDRSRRRHPVPLKCNDCFLNKKYNL
jgi:hypothetical protein